jgi:hypothetical protein
MPCTESCQDSSLQLGQVHWVDVTVRTVATRPHRVEFPDATPDDFLVRNHSCSDLEGAIYDARIALGWALKSDGSPGNDAQIAVITNRGTGYRWILRRGSATVEFQTAGMLAEQVADDHLHVYLSVEEAEALAGAAESAEIHEHDKRRAAVIRQAIEQMRLLAGQVREARLRAETNIHPHASLLSGF